MRSSLAASLSSALVYKQLLAFHPHAVKAQNRRPQGSALWRACDCPWSSPALVSAPDAAVQVIYVPLDSTSTPS
ncbi:hypothetical protein BD626DRAFT_475071 [Schizophyllum amplum]|uniref:Uncharacterized protein n=1 Tax=Schizophyllum amplum TaxID=97359 RepID=A0A550CY59_9AGAR|nr:hypothetical protein BD626DRAFT_475071 [Auriculariopsis ampla]